jgi:hypothetical protein
MSDLSSPLICMMVAGHLYFLENKLLRRIFEPGTDECGSAQFVLITKEYWHGKLMKMILAGYIAFIVRLEMRIKFWMKILKVKRTRNI